MSGGAVRRTAGTSDFLVLGAGPTALGLADRLARAGTATVTVVEPPDGPPRPPERTWCFWGTAADDVEPAVRATWSRLRIHAPDGDATTVDPRPLTYRMLRSASYERLVRARLDASPGARVLRASAGSVRAADGGAEVRCSCPDGGELTLRARLVFDSRPAPAAAPARTTLLQDVTGWFVRTAHRRFDPAVADLMDFRVTQPPHGLAFGHVLPLAPDHALVGYTECARPPLTPAAHAAALSHYCRKVLGLGAFTVEAAEHGVVPVTDARFPRRAGPAVLRIGTAGGATRPPTGRALAAVRRESRAAADALRDGGVILPAPHGRHALALDAVLLRALDTGRIDGPAYFTRLFRTTPAERVLRFLDGTASSREEWGIRMRGPVLPMLRTAAELPFLPRRPRPGAAPATEPERNRR